MLRQLLLSDFDATRQEAEEGWALLAEEFPTVAVQPLASGEGSQVLCLDVEEWGQPHFDPSSWDARVFSAAEGAEHLALHLVDAWGGALAAAALEILTRYQGLIGRRNAASSVEAFSALLARHRALHDLGKPLVRADYQHALDTWQWVLRLAPEADLAVQAAALGTELVCGLLEELKVDPATCERVRWLVTRHECPGEDAALALLHDADALSFFSLTSCSFIRSFSPEHTRREVASTLDRLRPENRARLEQVRLAPDVRRLLDAQLRLSHVPSSPPQESASRVLQADEGAGSLSGA